MPRLVEIRSYRLLAMIDTYLNTLLWVPDDAVPGIRRLNGGDAAGVA
jgi:hypothetical protein